MKLCKSCNLTKAKDEFYAHPKAFDGKDSSCKHCRKAKVNANRISRSEYYREYDRNRPNHEERNLKNIERTNTQYSENAEFREKIQSTKAKWAIKNTHKRKAQNALSNAIRDGKVIKPLECEHCGNSEKKIQGHHWSYDAEHWLDVVWLCTSCHGKEHKRLNDLGRDPDKIIGERNG